MYFEWRNKNKRMKKDKLIQHIWTVICSQSTLDSESNNLTLVNVIEKFTLPIPSDEMKKAKEAGARGFAFPVNFEITSLFRKSDGEKTGLFDMRIRMLNPEGETMSISAEQKLGFKEGIRSFRVRNRFMQLFVEKTGDYWFVIEIKNVEEAEYFEVGRIPLEIVINQTEAPTIKK
jgi:hypothetical protein